MKKGINILFAALLLAACERDTSTLGPNLSDIYGEFKVFENFAVAKPNVNFTTGESEWFTARFSKTVDWEVHIIGQTSGAEKIITGKSGVLDQSNSLWNGSTTVLPMFKAEPCIAILTVPDEQFADTITLTVAGTKVNTGFVVADFESGINPGWTIFKQTGANMSFNIVASPTAAQANNYYDMGGEVDWDYLIGLMDFPSSAYQEPAFPLSSNPANVYFNVFLGVPTGVTNEIVLFQFREDENGDGIYQSNEDMYSLELKNLPEGWQTISVKYADLVALVNGVPSTPAGNALHEPNKLLMVSMLFLADPASGYSQTFMDYIIFTENAPLEP